MRRARAPAQGALPAERACLGSSHRIEQRQMRRSLALASAPVSLVLVLGVVYGLFALAARHYAPSAPASGASASAVKGWVIVAPGQAEPLTPSLDLAHQAATSGVALIATAGLNSAVLLLVACALAFVIGIPLGFWVAVSAPRPVAAAVRATSSVGITFPAFFLVFLLQLVAIRLTETLGHLVVPVFGYGLDAHIVLPALALALAPMAYSLRLVALAAEDIAQRDFVRTARAKGLSERVVIYRHIASNMVGTLGESMLGGVRLALGGLVIVEYLLVWPGLGVLILRAANVQDVPVLLGSVLVLATAFLAVEIALDALTAPRRTSAG